MQSLLVLDQISVYIWKPVDYFVPLYTYLTG